VYYRNTILTLEHLIGIVKRFGFEDSNKGWLGYTPINGRLSDVIGHKMTFMDEHTQTHPLVDNDGELVQPDKDVDMKAYSNYVRNFRARARIPMIEFDADTLLSYGCMGFAAFVFLVLILYMSNH
jgi:hypothetical protein